MSQLKDNTQLAVLQLFDLITLSGNDFEYASFLANKCDSRSTLVRRAWLKTNWDIERLTDKETSVYLKETVLYSLLSEDLTLSRVNCISKPSLEWVKSSYLLNRQDSETVLQGFRNENIEFAKIKHITRGIYDQMIALIEQEQMMIE